MRAGTRSTTTSSYSTLDVIDVLYKRDALRPERPQWEGRDRFLLSKGHGPLAFYAVLVKHGFFPAEELDRFLTVGRHPRRAS